MKIEVNQDTIDKLMKKRATAFNKEIRDLKAKLERRDKRIQKLAHEIEKLKGDMMETERGVAVKIAQIAYALVSEMESANWVRRYHTCDDPDLCDCGDFI